MKKIVFALSQFCAVVCKILEVIMIVLLAIMVVIMFLQIVLRAGLKTAIVWGEEMLRYLFIIDTFIGSAVCLYHGDLSRFELLSDKLPPMKKRILFTFIDLFIITLLALVTEGSFPLIIRQMQQLGTSVKIPMGYVYCMIPVSSIAGILFLAVKILKAWILPEEENKCK